MALGSATTGTFSQSAQELAPHAAFLVRCFLMDLIALVGFPMPGVSLIIGIDL